MRVIKGSNIEAKMKSIDAALVDLKFLKTYKKTKLIYPPNNISSFQAKGGIVLRYLFGIDGALHKGYIFIEDMPKNGIVITVQVQGVGGGMNRSIEINKQEIDIQERLEVKRGDRLEVFVEAKNEDEIVSNIWTSFLFTPLRAGDMLSETRRLGNEGVSSGN